MSRILEIVLDYQVLLLTPVNIRNAFPLKKNADWFPLMRASRLNYYLIQGGF